MKNKTIFNWKCPHCEHRNSTSVAMQFEMPRHYNTEWDCDECGETSRLEFNFTVSSWLNNKKIPKLRKRKQEEKKKLKMELRKINNEETKRSSCYEGRTI